MFAVSFQILQDLLMPGQFVRARLIGAVRPNAIFVPQQSVMQSSKGLFVYIVNQENIVEMRPIEGGEWYKDMWIIKSGLEKEKKLS